jgi:four helix bundle protein
MATKLEDLRVWTKGLEFWEAVNAILDGSALCKDRDLLQQIRDAIDSVISNIAEGFEQPTDRSFAPYLYRSKASAAEVKARLFIAWRRGYIDKVTHDHCVDLSDQICRMLTAFIQYLQKTDRKRRGAGLDVQGR